MKVLVISKSFPPRTGALPLQVAKTVQALQTAGCEVSVLAGRDEALHATPDDCRLVNSPDLYPVSYGSRINSRSPLVTGLRGLWREIQATNPCSAWVKMGTAEAIKVVSRVDPDIVLSVAVPFDSHLVAMNLMRYRRIPWVASFSDPFPGDVWLRVLGERSRTWWMSCWQRRMTRRVIAAADRIHVPTAHLAATISTGVGVLFDHKIAVVPHIGYPRPLPLQAAKGNGWLMHIGHLKRTRHMPHFLLAMKLCLERNPDLFNGLMCVGSITAKFMDDAKALGLSSRIHCLGQFPYEDSVRSGLAASALLLLEADTPYSAHMPSKLADYASMRRPILAVTPERSITTEYLAVHRVGVAVPHDVTKIANAIEHVMDFEAFSPIAFDSFAKVFEPATVARSYCGIFRETITS